MYLPKAVFRHWQTALLSGDVCPYEDLCKLKTAFRIFLCPLFLSVCNPEQPLLHSYLPCRLRPLKCLIFDFSQAVFSSSEDNIKKIREKFFKRIIAAVLVFLSPLFVKLILNLSNEVWDWINPNTCIK